MTLCSFGIHKWNKWQETKRESALIWGAYDRQLTVMVVVQERACNRCGLGELRADQHNCPA